MRNFSDLPFPNLQCKPVMLSLSTQAKAKDLKKKKINSLAKNAKRKEKSQWVFWREVLRVLLQDQQAHTQNLQRSTITAKLYLDVARYTLEDSGNTGWFVVVHCDLNHSSCSEFKALGMQKLNPTILFWGRHQACFENRAQRIYCICKQLQLLSLRTRIRKHAIGLLLPPVLP